MRQDDTYEFIGVWDEQYKRVGFEVDIEGRPIERLIRCKDCKFATIAKGVYGKEPEVKYCDIWFPKEAEYMPINYFCASAERKEDG